MFFLLFFSLIEPFPICFCKFTSDIVTSNQGNSPLNTYLFTELTASFTLNLFSTIICEHGMHQNDSVDFPLTDSNGS